MEHRLFDVMCDQVIEHLVGFEQFEFGFHKSEPFGYISNIKVKKQPMDKYHTMIVYYDGKKVRRRKHGVLDSEFNVKDLRTGRMNLTIVSELAEIFNCTKELVVAEIVVRIKKDPRYIDFNQKFEEKIDQELDNLKKFRDQKIDELLNDAAEKFVKLEYEFSRERLEEALDIARCNALKRS